MCCFFIKIRPWHIFYLPFWWYNTVLDCVKTSVIEMTRSDSKGTGFWHYSIRLAICLQDRRFIDNATSRVSFNLWPPNCQWQAFFDVGLALYDLGYRDEGIDYLERALSISDQIDYSYINYHQLCCRLNMRKNWDKRLEYAQKYEKRFPQKNEIAKMMLAKSYIDFKEFEKANKITNELITIHPNYNIFLADLYYAKGEYQKASNYFEKYQLQNSLYVWFPQYDYKEAVSYYKSGQPIKWQDKAKKMGRRLAWDKFYTLDYLEDEGVERIPEIDQTIEWSRQKKRLIYIDKLSLCLQRLPWVLWKTYLMYPYEVLLLTAGTIFFIMLIRAFVLYL